MEAPEIQSGIVEIKSVAREAGARSKIAVFSNDEHIDPSAPASGKRARASTPLPENFPEKKLTLSRGRKIRKNSSATRFRRQKSIGIEIDEKERKAVVEVADGQLSLAIGKGGQNVRLAAKLTGWRIDIKGDEPVLPPRRKIERREKRRSQLEESELSEASREKNQRKKSKKLKRLKIFIIII